MHSANKRSMRSDSIGFLFGCDSNWCFVNGEQQGVSEVVVDFERECQVHTGQTCDT